MGNEFVPLQNPPALEGTQLSSWSGSSKKRQFLSNVSPRTVSDHSYSVGEMAEHLVDSFVCSLYCKFGHHFGDRSAYARNERKPTSKTPNPMLCGLGPETVGETQDGDGQEEIGPQIECLA